MTVFYELPVGSVRPGMWTNDAQEITDVYASGDCIMVSVYTPRPDDPDEDEYNASTPETRIFSPGDYVGLMWCEDTPVDASGTPGARNVMPG